MPPKATDYQGQTFNLLTAIQWTGKYAVSKGGNKKRIWQFQCACGNTCEKVMEKVVKGWVKSCGCIRADQHWGVDAIRNQVYGEQYADGDLTLEQFIELSQQNCAICGEWKPNCRSGRTNKDICWHYHGLDRIDNNQVHNSCNVQPCCWECNNMRSDLLLSYFYEKLQKIIKYQKRKAI